MERHYLFISELRSGNNVSNNQMHYGVSSNNHIRTDILFWNLHVRTLPPIRRCFAASISRMICLFLASNISRTNFVNYVSSQSIITWHQPPRHQRLIKKQFIIVCQITFTSPSSLSTTILLTPYIPPSLPSPISTTTLLSPYSAPSPSPTQRPPPPFRHRPPIPSPLPSPPPKGLLPLPPFHHYPSNPSLLPLSPSTLPPTQRHTNSLSRQQTIVLSHTFMAYLGRLPDPPPSQERRGPLVS